MKVLSWTLSLLLATVAVGSIVGHADQLLNDRYRALEQQKMDNFYAEQRAACEQNYSEAYWAANRYAQQFGGWNTVEVHRQDLMVENCFSSITFHTVNPVLACTAELGEIACIDAQLKTTIFKYRNF